MITKHFFKILILFVVMIILGLAGIILVGHFDKTKTEQQKTLNNPK